MPSVLHITPHLGGGVGRVVVGLLAHAQATQSLWRHRVRCLEAISPETRRLAKRAAIEVTAPRTSETSAAASTSATALVADMAAADVILVHWWNHPLLYRLFSKVAFPKSRLLIWSHVSGFCAPQILTSSTIDFVDRCVLATPYSENLPAVRSLTAPVRAKKVRTVFTCAGIARTQQAKPTAHDGFIVGYVGTVDYCKLHPEFLQMSASVPDAEFVICGGNHHKRIAADALRLGFQDRFNFLGPVQNITAQLSRFDVFGYPLQREHYGTGEQALIEALAAGVPPVVFSGGAESFVVEHGETGLVVETTEEYTNAICTLMRDQPLRSRLSKNGRRAARDRFNISTTATAWNNVLDEAMHEPKRNRRWVSSQGSTAAPGGSELFLKSHGRLGSQWASQWNLRSESTTRGSCHHDRMAHFTDGFDQAKFAPLFSSRTRGSAFHYLNFFPDDSNLRQWCEWWTINEPTGQERTG